METVRGKHLGVELRRLREAADLKHDAACAQLEWSRSKLDRVEAGVTIPKPGDLTRALDLYGADDTTRAYLTQLSKDAKTRRRGWWQGFPDVFNGPLPALEDDATAIRAFELGLIPGLAQTSAYARALISAARPEDPPDAIDMRVRARIARQAAVLERQHPPALHFIVDEAALLRQVGGRQVLMEQISALWTLSQRPGITVQIVPLTAGAHAGLPGGFELLDFDSVAYPMVAFTSSQAGDVYLEGATDLTRLEHAWGRLAVAALPPADSARMLAELTRR